MFKPIYEFAIKREVLNSGVEKYTPMVRPKSRMPFVKAKWNRITKIYDEYLTMELPFEPSLSLEQCETHIKEYRVVLGSQDSGKTKLIEFLTQ